MEHMTRDTLERLRRRELAPAELVKVLRHVSDCPQCAELGEEMFAGDLAALRDTGSIGETSSEHPDADTELMAYVDGRADAASREIIETHLEECESCRAEVRGLRAAAAEFASARRSTWWLAVAAILIILIAIAVMVDNRPAGGPRQRPPVISTAPPVDSTASPRRVPYANARWESLVSDALRTARLPYPRDLDALREGEDRLRSNGDGGKRLRFAPAGNVVDETRPRFVWPSVGDATYVVSVFDNENLIAQSKALRRSEWTPERELPRGRTLLWQVEATHGGAVELLPSPPDPQAMFRIAGADEHADLERAKREHPDDPLLLAVLYARAGLRDEALDALRRVDVERVPEAKRLQSANRGEPKSTGADQ